MGIGTQVVGPRVHAGLASENPFPQLGFGFGDVLVERGDTQALFLENEGPRIGMARIFGGCGEALCQVYFEPQQSRV